MNWESLSIQVMDFEGSITSGIVEYGVVTLVGGEIVETYGDLCSATGKLSTLESRTHGIYHKDLEGKDVFGSQWELFIGLRKAGIFAAHHAQVERSLITNEWSRPSAVPNFSKPGQQVVEWGPWIDSYKIYTRLGFNFEDYKLQSLIERLSLSDSLNELANKFCTNKRRRYHSALYDTLASAILLQQLPRFVDPGTLTLNWLLAQSAPSTEKKQSVQQMDLF